MWLERMSGVLFCTLPETRVCIPVVSSGGGLRKHEKEWGRERGKEGTLIHGTLMSGLLLRATEAQPCWGPLRECIEHAQDRRGAAGELAIYPAPASLAKTVSGTCP